MADQSLEGQPGANLHEPNETGRRQPNSENTGRYRTCRPRDRAAFVVSIISVIIALGAAGVTWYQGNIANQYTSKQLRAYIFAKPLSEVWALKGTPEVYVYFRNGGQTPASNLKVRGAIKVMPDSPTNNDFATAPVVHESNDVLDPSSEINFQNLFRLKRALRDDEIAKIATGEKAKFYVWGEISYDDVFNEAHHTPFCFSYFGVIQHGNGLRSGNLTNCPKPNSN